MDSPRSRLGTLSTSSTRVTICHLVAPMHWAASMTPVSISSRLCSTMRAMNGAAESVSGTSAAVAPMDVPTSSRVNGMMKNIKMMNGRLRRRFTSHPNTALKRGAGATPPAFVTVSSTPMGRPSTYANSVANSVIYKVSSVPSHSSAPYSLKNSAIVFTPLCPAAALSQRCAGCRTHPPPRRTLPDAPH